MTTKYCRKIKELQTVFISLPKRKCRMSTGHEDRLVLIELMKVLTKQMTTKIKKFRVISLFKST